MAGALLLLSWFPLQGKRTSERDNVNEIVLYSPRNVEEEEKRKGSEE
jgi:hypothetical protein